MPFHRVAVRRRNSVCDRVLEGLRSHTSPKLALRTALLEAVEADALMIRWYTLTKSRRVIVDDAQIFGDLAVELISYEYTIPGSPGHVFAVAVLRKGNDRPTVLLGTGAGLNPSAVLYRTLIEAVAIYYIAYNGPVLQPRDYLAGGNCSPLSGWVTGAAD